MIYGIVGKPGAGKTYLATKHALDNIKKGVEVYSNYRIIGARKYDSLLDILQVRRGFIVVDEINLLAPSRYFESFPPQLAYFWSQSRKFGLTICWTAQSIERVDKIIREITNYVYDMRTLAGFLYWGKEWEPKDLEINTGRVEKNFLSMGAFGFYNKKVYDNYDTFESVEIPDHILRQLARKWGSFDFRGKDPKTLPLITSLPNKRSIKEEKLAQKVVKGSVASAKVSALAEPCASREKKVIHNDSIDPPF